MQQEVVSLSPLVEGSKSPFLLASTGDLTGLELAQVSLGGTDQEGCTLLHCASKNGHLQVMQHLIDRGIELEAVDKAGNTALHLAVANGQTEAMDLLLACGASSNVLNQAQDTPLHIAV